MQDVSSVKSFAAALLEEAASSDTGGRAVSSVRKKLLWVQYRGVEDAFFPPVIV